MKVMVVDDSRAMRLIVARALRHTGLDVEVHEAVNGKEALDAMASVRPDLVLSDWNMPEMNGIDLLRALRSVGDEVRFGFVTSEGNPVQRELALAAGADFLLTKPFDAEDLRFLVEGLAV
jgi:two-component system chemotaxis response regulator CheY